MRKRETFGTGN